MKKLIINGRVKILHKEYSAFREDIIDFIKDNVLPSAKSVLDPMAGTAPLIPYVERFKLKAIFNDINPIHFYINRAKCFDVAKIITTTWYKKPNMIIGELSSLLRPLEKNSLIISDKWIPDKILDILIRAWKKSDHYDKILSYFFKSIILKCVRPYSSLSKSEKNATWLKPGGMILAEDIKFLLKSYIDRYLAYYSYFYSDFQKDARTNCKLLTGDARLIDSKKKYDAIFTSPAYANRYDFTRLFAPEIYFLSNMELSPKIDELKEIILASNVVKEYLSPDEDLEFLSRVTPKTYDFLMEVKSKGKSGEKDYYLRYFTKYYKNLYDIFYTLMDKLTPKGALYIVIQNNIHRGELNDMDSFIENFFVSNGYKVKRVFEKMRTHQGKRNISGEHPLVLKKQLETILMVKK